MISDQLLFGMSDEHVIDVGIPHKLHPKAATAFSKLQDSARELGVDCQLVSSFRPFSRQLAIWQKKWQGQAPLYNAKGEKLEFATLTDEDKLDVMLTWSALPGASRHHWGTDMDVYDKQSVEKQSVPFELVEKEYSPGGPCYALSQFLEKHAEEFGFYLPYNTHRGGVAREPWHISFQSLAQNYLAELDTNRLYNLLEKSEIGGKSLILKNFDAIMQRFVFNNQNKA